MNNLHDIEEINLGANNITKLEGVTGLDTLKKLNLTHNKILKLENVSKLKNLQKLLIRENPLEEGEFIDPDDYPFKIDFLEDAGYYEDEILN